MRRLRRPARSWLAWTGPKRLNRQSDLRPTWRERLPSRLSWCASPHGQVSSSAQSLLPPHLPDAEMELGSNTYLTGLLEGLPAGINADYQTLRGHAASMLIEYSRNQNGVLVVATHGESGSHVWHLGSTTEQNSARLLGSCACCPRGPPRPLTRACPLRPHRSPRPGPFRYCPYCASALVERFTGRPNSAELPELRLRPVSQPGGRRGRGSAPRQPHPAWAP